MFGSQAETKLFSHDCQFVGQIGKLIESANSPYVASYINTHTQIHTHKTLVHPEMKIC